MRLQCSIAIHDQSNCTQIVFALSRLDVFFTWSGFFSACVVGIEINFFPINIQLTKNQCVANTVHLHHSVMILLSSVKCPRRCEPGSGLFLPLIYLFMLALILCDLNYYNFCGKSWCLAGKLLLPVLKGVMDILGSFACLWKW